MVTYGIDILLENPPEWKSKRIGLVTNNAAVTTSNISSRLALIAHGFNLQKLFSPEHGLEAVGADGAKMPNGMDDLTGLPIISLYGDRLAPNEADVSNLDIILFDIPDIGCRFYTYLWTLTYVLEACAKYHKPFYILDRPNPLGGDLKFTEGPFLDEENCASFVGRWHLPVKHGCTLGELTLYFNQTRTVNADVHVVGCEGWERRASFPGWENDFVPTSPAIPNFKSMVHYPALCFLEATNISEGRGTDFPFQVMGAPWLNSGEIKQAFEKISGSLPNLQEQYFTPIEGKYAHERCVGLRLKVEETQNYPSVFVGMLLIKLIKNFHPNYFKWMPYKTHANPIGQHHLNKLLGIPNSETIFELPLEEFIIRIKKEIEVAEKWSEEIRPYLLYN